LYKRRIAQHAQKAANFSLRTLGIEAMTSKAAPPSQPAWFIVHDLAHATAALKVAQRHRIPVMLVSAHGAVRSGGAGWWRDLIARARSQTPEADMVSILDCADEAGMALAAIRAGVEAIAVTAPHETLARIADIARQSSVSLISIPWADAVDLAQANDPQATCENHLVQRAGGVANPDALG
jgi:hypothetical protein